MRNWHVESIIDPPYWAVFRDDQTLYAWCPNQAMAANVCAALNYHEQVTMEKAFGVRDVEVQP